MRLAIPIFMFALLAASGARAQYDPTPPPPGAPIIKLPLEVVEPNKTVPASEWNSPYCGHWDDGCMECARSEFSEHARCKAKDGTRHEPADLQSATCRRRAIICDKVMDEAYFNKVCRAYLYENFFQRKNGDVIAYETGMSVRWSVKGEVYSSERIADFDPNLLLGSGESILTSQGYVAYDSERDGSFYGASGLGAVGIRCLAVW
jgi:hypothetical protein